MLLVDLAFRINIFFWADDKALVFNINKALCPHALNVLMNDCFTLIF